MKYSYIIADLDKEYVQETQVLTKAYLETKGAGCLLHHTPERTRGGAHTGEAQVPGDTEYVITIGGGGTLIQAAKDSAGRNIPVLGADRGHLGHLNRMGRQEDIVPILGSLLNERYQLKRRMMIHGTTWRKREILSKDIVLSEITITRKDPLKVLRYSVYINDEYFNEYTADGALIATSIGSMAYNPSAGGPVIVPGARMMVLAPTYSRSLNTRSIVLAPEDRVQIKVLNSGQVVSFDGDTSMELKAGDCVDIRCSELQTVMIELKQISFIQDLSDHLGGL